MQISRRNHELLCGVLSAIAIGIRGKTRGLCASLILLYFVKEYAARAKAVVKGKQVKPPLWCTAPFVPLVVAVGLLSRGQKLAAVAALVPSWLCCLPDRFELPSSDFLGEQLAKDEIDQGAVISEREADAHGVGIRSEIRCLKGYEKGLMESHEKSPGCRTVRELAETALKKYSNNNFMGTRQLKPDGSFGPYIFTRYQECFQEMDHFIAGLIKTFPGIYGGCEASGRISADAESRANDGLGQSKIGYYSRNTEELCKVMVGALTHGLICVPVYDTLGEGSVEYVIQHSNLRVICVGESNLDTIQDIILQCPSLKAIIVLPDASMPRNSRLRADTGPRMHHGAQILPYEQVVASGASCVASQAKAKTSRPSPEDLSFIMYTSGTTGTPKGVILTQGGMVAAASALCTTVEVGEKDVHLSFLPMAHCFEICVQMAGIICGASGQLRRLLSVIQPAVTPSIVGFFHGNVKELTADAQALRPTIFIGVPRVYQRVQQIIFQQFAAKPWPIRRLIYHACKSQLTSLRSSGKRNPLWDVLVFRQVKAALGGRVRIMCTGSAPLAPEMMEFIRMAFNVPMVEGYGMTETHGICNAQSGGIMVDGKRRYEGTVGNVGPSVPSSMMRLESVPELKYTVDDKSYPRGEVLIGGTNIFKGYYKQPELTAAALTEDGWLRTGDIGKLNKNGTLSIIDRRKNMFKLSQGEYVAAEALELLLLGIPYVGQIFIYGDSTKAYLVAVVVPDPLELLPKLKRGEVKGFEPGSASAAKIPTLSLDLESWLGPFHELCCDEVSSVKLQQFLLEEIVKFSKKNKLRGFEFVKKIHVEGKLNPLMQGFSVENDCLTPTFKLKRKTITDKYATRFKEMYEEDI